MGYRPPGYKRVGLHLTTKKQQASEGEGGTTPLKKNPSLAKNHVPAKPDRPGAWE